MASNGDVKGYGAKSQDGFEIVHPKGRELLGGDLLGQSLKALGVEVAFGIHGGHLDAFLYGAAEAGIKLVDVRHEAVAVNAAEAYAKVKKTVGVCFATANSGFSNALAGLATAFGDRSPVFCITSSPPLRDAESNCLQGVHDQVVVAKNLTKFAHRVTSPGEIPRLVAYAFRTAIAGAPGPTLIDFPIDILFTPVDVDEIAWGSITKPFPYAPAPHPEAIKETISMLKASKRPLMICGTGASNPKLREDLTKLVETLQLPTFFSLKSTSALPVDHPLQAGNAWSLGGLEKMPDLVILLGARPGMFLGNRSGAVLPPSGCKFIQIDTDGSEIGKAQAIDLGITAEVHLTVQALNEALTKDSSVKSEKSWVETAMKLSKAPHPHENDPKVNEKDGRTHPLHALRAVFSSLEPGYITLLDGGDAMLWGGDSMLIGKPSLCMFASGYLGMLANGFGYALGAAIADPSRQIIHIQGDGSAGFHIQELDTFQRFGCNILTIVVNNQIWGMSTGGQSILFGKNSSARPAADNLNPAAAYEKVGEAFGMKGKRVDKLEDIPAAVKELSGGPGVINLIVSNLPVHPGTVAMVDYTEDPNMIIVPYYSNIKRK